MDSFLPIEKLSTKPGQVQILTGYRSGWIGTVAPERTWLEGEEFCVRFDHDPPRQLQRVLIRHDQFALEPISDPPGWLPPLSTDDLAFLDEAGLRFCAALGQKGNWRWSDENLYELIAMSWQRRLPIQAEEVWQVCAAHGMPPRYRRRFVGSFEFGVGLLVYSQGRSPIKRRRVPAMSIGRYEPKRRNRKKIG